MRSLQSASDSWQEFKHYQSLQELKEAVRLDGHTSAASAGLRSACWKAVLLFESVNTEEWPRVISSSRSAYNSLRMHFLRYFDNPDELAEAADPLSENQESSVWTEIRKDEELRAEILQDVERCMPENVYFRQPDTQRMMLDVLFIFCKLNQDVGYRQGMHELLAPILWVVMSDAIDLGQSSKAMGEDAIVRAVFDAEHIEHDSFALFSQVMHSAKNFYEQSTHLGADNPIVVRSRRIFSELLPQVDKELAQHLESIDIVPQVFLMRWIRLLFGREFSFDEMLTMWDVLFVEDTSLQLVDQISVVMLLRMRWELLDADYNTALTILLRYPQDIKGHPPQSLVLDALYLREHMTVEGGSYLVLKHTGRPVQPQDRPITPPAMQRNITTFSGLAAAKAASTAASFSPSRQGRQNNIEALFQSTAKNIYARGEALGIGKVVRNAVDEVHKKALEIRESQTPSSADLRARGPRGGPGALYNRIAALESRNKQLSEMLEGAVSELWDYQKVAAEQNTATDGEPVDLERLNVAVAKVQFVQVYLGDSNLPLPEAEPARKDSSDEFVQVEKPDMEDETQPTKVGAPHDDKSQAETPQPTASSQVEDDKLADPSTFDENETPEPTSPAQKPTEPPRPATPPAKIPSPPAPEPKETPPPRPPLDQSSFSWMLGESSKTAPSSFNQASPFSASKSNNSGSRGMLFGGTDSKADDDDKGSPERKRPAKPRVHKKAAATAAVVGGEEEVFDLSTLRHAKKS